MSVSAVPMQSVRVEDSDTCGRRKLVATSRFAPGQCILEELPYAYSLLDKKRGLYCDFCLKKCSTRLRCANCKYVWYCNRSCQQSDWTRCRHKHHCEKIKTMHPRVPDHLALLLSEITRKPRQPLPCTEDDEDRFPTNLDQLVNHDKKLIEKLKDDDELQSMVSLFEDWIVCTPEAELINLVKMLGATDCNSFTICDNDLNGIAEGIYLRASMANHSCAPNCAVVFDGLKLQIRTIKDIAEGEECTITYSRSINPAKERQTDLEKKYHFICKCVKCDEEINASGPANDDLGEELQGLKISWEQIQESQDLDEVFELCEPYLKPMASIPANNHLLVHVRDLAFEEYMCIDSTEGLEKAAEIGLLNKEPFKFHYGPYTAKLGIYFLTMGELLLKLERRQEARKYLTEAKRVLEVTHGPQHSLMLTKVQELHAQAVGLPFCLY